jgi:hypothetical protein
MEPMNNTPLTPIKKHVVSFSGGRTSAYLCHVMLEKFGKDNVDFVFMDTAAEHQETYSFIKKCVDYFDIDLVCLQADFNQPLGEGHSYNIVPVESLKQDLVNGPYAQMVKKYGIPTVKSAWCTSRMKEETHNKYCADKYPDNNFITVIGMRADEPKRYYGKTAWNAIKGHPYDWQEAHKIFLGKSDLWIAANAKEALALRRQALESVKIKYLCEFSDFSKPDVNDFWSGMLFDLEIEDHLGNCVFCMKKSIGKIALAQRDEPELESQFNQMIQAGSGRLNTGEIKKGVMYRGLNSLESIKIIYQDASREEIKNSLKSMKDNSACSESCEAFGQMDLLGSAA